MVIGQTVKMDPKVKALVVHALRSGEYQQGHGYLRRTLNSYNGTQGYCCLGVVCDLYQKETGKGTWGSVSTLGTSFITDTENSVTDLPTDVQVWAGLTDDDVRAELARKNDSRNYDFNDIADTIENNL